MFTPWNRQDDPRALAAASTEVWAPVPSCPQSYWVSNLGRVLSFVRDAAKPRRLQGTTLRSGYTSVSLYETPGVHATTWLLHRLVVTAFDGEAPSPQHTDVRHLDGNSRNNRLDNLAWGTRAENMQDVHRHRQLGTTPHPDVPEVRHRGRYDLTERMVEAGRALWRTKRLSTADLAAVWDVSMDTVANVMRDIEPEGEGEEAPRRDPVQIQAWVEQGWNREQINQALPPGAPPLTHQDVYYYRSKLRSSAVTEPLTCAQLRGRVDALDVTQLSDTTTILTREELLRVTRAEGAGVVEAVLLPAVLECLRRRVAACGWFYPPVPSDSLDAVRASVQAKGLRLSEASRRGAIPGGTSEGTAWLQSQFPAFWQAGDAVGAFHDPRKLEAVVRYRMGLNNSKPYTYRLSDGETVTAQETFDVTLATIRRGFVVQRRTVSFFKPVVAAAIYHRILGDMKRPVVWDPSGGFGGRMLGFASMYPEGEYWANEPAHATFQNLQAARKLLGCRGVTLQGGSEHGHRLLNAGTVDMVFTSPPYFDREKWFDEPGQCWRDYPTMLQWRAHYLNPTLGWACEAIRTFGAVVINVSEPLANVVIDEAHEVGLKLEETLQLALTADHFARARSRTSTRYEPILVFRRA